jgi:hypothetical protein
LLERAATVRMADTVVRSYNIGYTLKFEIKPGENTADFEVSSK